MDSSGPRLAWVKSPSIMSILWQVLMTLVRWCGAGKAPSPGLARFAGWQARQTLHAVFAVALGSTVAVPCAAGQPGNHFDNGQASTPPMGFNTWNTFKMNPTEKVVRQITLSAMAATG